MHPSSWENAFVAVTVALGGSREEAALAMGTALRSPESPAGSLDADLRSEDRGIRARKIARILFDLAREIDKAGVRWPS